MKFKANLAGHSGCVIHLLEDETGKAFVRKSSGSEGYNARLEAQCRKQAEFSHPVLRAPRVIREGHTPEGLFFFDMEYVKGLSLSEYVKTIEAYKMRSFVGGFVDCLLNSPRTDSDTAAPAFARKLAELERTTAGRAPEAVEPALKRLNAFDWSGFGLSACHGDLTMENVIIRGDDIYLIDFLDSFYDSVYIDLGKLLQDVIAMWSYRREPVVSDNTKIRLKVFNDLLTERIGGAGSAHLNNALHALLLHLLRIIPYTRDDATLAFVASKINLVNSLISNQQ